MTTETQAPDPAPAKPFFAYDPENGVEWFETMQEAQAYAAESLREYRRSASFDGEWSGDVEAVKVGHVTHFVAEHGDDESGYDYRLVTAIPAPEGAQVAEIQPLPQAEFDALMDHIYEYGTMAEGITARARAMCQAYARAAIRAALAAPAPQAAPVAWCELTEGGQIAYFDGKPMVMPGPVGNDCHPHPLYLGAAQASAPAPKVPAGMVLVPAYDVCGKYADDAPGLRADCAAKLERGQPCEKCPARIVQAPAVQDGLTDEQRIDWLCEEAVYTCGQWQVVFDSDKKSFIDAVDELAALAHGIDKGQPPVQGSGS